MKKVYLLSLVLLSACASKPPAPDLTGGENPKQMDFERGLKALDSSRFSEAVTIFDRLLVQKPATEFDLVTLYNSASAYEGMGNCAKAADRYRQVVRSSATKFKKLEGQALFRLSLQYECIGQDTKAVTALLDARKNSQHLSYETVNAEIPARLAAAYARLGNREKALEYFNQASKGLKSIVGQGSRVQKDLLGRTLFLMGQLTPSQRDGKASPSTFLQSLSMQQAYLLQAVEMNHPNWSPKAADDLRLAYDNIWRYDFKDVEQRRDFYIRGLQTARELRRIRLPSTDPLQEIVFSQVGQTESRLQSELAKVSATNRLTPEAEKRDGLKREGRVKK